MLPTVFVICLSTALLREATAIVDGGKTNICQEKDGILPNPDATDCKSYIACKNGSYEEFECSEGLLYNPFKRTCDYNTSIACDDGKAIQIIETTHSIPTTDVKCDVCNCVYLSQNSCSEYYYCVDGVAYKDNCPLGLNFDAKKFTCDYEQNMDCSITVPTAASENSDEECDDIPDCSEVDCNCLYPSKLDCAAYYMCEDGAPHLFSCSPGLLFNEKTRTCDYDYNVYCKNTATTSVITYSTKKGEQDEDSTAVSLVSINDDENTQETDSTNKDDENTQETDSTNDDDENTQETDSTNKEDENTQVTDSTNDDDDENTEETDSTNNQEIASTESEQTSEDSTSMSETPFPHTNNDDRTTSTIVEANETISEITDEIRFTDTEMSTANTINETVPETTKQTHETTLTNTEISEIPTTVSFSVNTETISEITSTDEETTTQSIEQTGETIYETTRITDEGTYTETTEKITKEIDNTQSSIFETESTSSLITSETIFYSTETTNDAKSTNTENSKTTTTKNTKETVSETTEITNKITDTGTEVSKISTTIENINETTEITTEATSIDIGVSKISTIKLTTENINRTTEISDDETFTNTDVSKTDIPEEPLETTVDDKITDDKSTNYFENKTATFSEKDSTIISNSPFTTEQDFSSEPNTITTNATYETRFTEFSTESTNMTTLNLSTRESVITESPDLQKSTTITTASINNLEDSTYSRQTTTNKDFTTESVVTESSLPDETSSIITEEDLRNFTCPSRFGLFPHPEKCTQFYQCSHWIPYLMECSDNLHFNPELLVCDWPYAAGCENKTETSKQIYSTHQYITDEDLVSTISSSRNTETTQKVPYTTVRDLISTDIDVTSRENTFETSQTNTKKTIASTMETTFDKNASTVEISENISGITEENKFTITDTIFTKYFETTTERYSDKDTNLNFTTTEADFSTEPNVVTDNKIVIINGTTLVQDSTTEFPKQPNVTTDFRIISTSEPVANDTLISSTKALPLGNTTTQMTTEISVNTTISKVTTTEGHTSERVSSDETYVTTTVEISHDFVCPSQFGLFFNPKNCSQFYQCSHWIAYRMNCPSSLHFNAELQVCDWPYKAGCENGTDSSTLVYSTQEDLTNKDIILSTLQSSTESGNSTKIYTTTVKGSTFNDKENTSSRETLGTEMTFSDSNNDTTQELDEQTTSYVFTTTSDKFTTTSEKTTINETTDTMTHSKMTDTSNTKPFETTTDYISDKETTDLFISTNEPDVITDKNIKTSYETTITENLTTEFHKETTVSEEITDTVNTKNFETSTETIFEELTVNSTSVTTPHTERETVTLPTKDMSTNFERTFTKDSKTDFSNETTISEKTTYKKYFETTTEPYAKNVTNSTVLTTASNTSKEPNIITTKSTMTTFKETENSNYDFTNEPTETTTVKLLTSGTFISSTKSSPLPNVTIQMITAKPELSTKDKENATFHRETTLRKDTTVDHFITKETSTDEAFLNITENIQNDFTCPTRFGLFPDIEDCSMFYECSQWIAYHIKCPPNLHFNPTLEVCDYPNEAGFENGSLTKSSTIFSTDVDTTVADTKANSTTPSFLTVSPTQDINNFNNSITTMRVSSKEITSDDLQNMTESTFYITTAINILNESTTETSEKETGTAATEKISVLSSSSQQETTQQEILTKDLSTESNVIDETTQSVATRDQNKLSTNTSNNITNATKSIVEMLSTVVNLITNTEPETSPIYTTEDTSKESTDKQSDFKCPARFGLFPDPNTCSKFYECYQWISSHLSCPSNLHFNPTLKVCDWPYEAGCNVSV